MRASSQHEYRYVLATFEGIRLLMPQHAVQSVEIIADLYVSQMESGAIGWFEQEHGQGQNSPVFCLDKEFALSLTISKTRQYLVLLKAPELPVGIICDTADMIDIKREFIILQELPSVMKTPVTPISQLALYQQNIVCVCQGEALVAYLALQSEQFMQQTQSAQKSIFPRRLTKS